MHEIPRFFVQSAPTMFRVACRGCHYRFTEIIYSSISEFYKCQDLHAFYPQQANSPNALHTWKMSIYVPICAKLISSFVKQADIPWKSRVPLGDSHHWTEKLLLKCLLEMLGPIWRTVAVWFNNNYPNVSKRC